MNSCSVYGFCGRKKILAFDKILFFRVFFCCSINYYNLHFFNILFNYYTNTTTQLPTNTMLRPNWADSILATTEAMPRRKKRSQVKFFFLVGYYFYLLYEIIKRKLKINISFFFHLDAKKKKICKN